MKKFQNKYRVPSARAQWWDYGNDGAYFITICTAHRECYFGDVLDGEMKLSNLGVLADVFMHEIKNHAKNVILDEYVVMPNHVHCILVLDGNEKNDNDLNDTLVSSVETTHALSLQSKQSNPQFNRQTEKTSGQQRLQNQGKNTISSIIGSYKSAVTKHSHRLGYEFEWQSRFHDNIIRDQESYNTILAYIKNNPAKWEDDKFHPSKPDTEI